MARGSFTATLSAACWRVPAAAMALLLAAGLWAWPLTALLLAAVADVLAVNLRLMGKPIAFWLILSSLLLVGLRGDLGVRLLRAADNVRGALVATALYALLWNVSNLCHGQLILDLGGLTKIAIALCVGVLIRTRGGVDLLLRMIAWAVATSVLVGTCQFIGKGWAFQLARGYQELPEIIFRPLYRIVGLSLDQINLADQLALCFPAVLGLMVCRRRRLDTVLFLMLTLGIFLNATRSVWITSIPICIWAWLKYGPGRPRTKLYVCLIGSLALVLASRTSPTALFFDALELNWGPEAMLARDVSIKTRLLRYQYTIQVFLQSPLWGVGPYNLAGSIQSLAGSQSLGSAHNEFLKTLAATGILGGVLLGIFYRSLWRYCRSLRTSLPRPDARFTRFLGLSLFACFAHSMFHNTGFWASSRLPWYFVGLLLAGGRMGAAREISKPPCAVHQRRERV